MFAKRIENGQGSSFSFESSRPQDKIDVSYSTFWNDFTHYSFHADAAAARGSRPNIEAPMAYNQLGNATEDMLFADQDKFVDSDANQDLFSYDELPNGKNK